MHEDEVRDAASAYMEREITDEEWRDALPQAQRKLEWIISREGDADGERRKPYYLGKLLEEIIRQNALSKYTIMICALNAERRQHETATAHT